MTKIVTVIPKNDIDNFAYIIYNVVCRMAFCRKTTGAMIKKRQKLFFRSKCYEQENF